MDSHYDNLIRLLMKKLKSVEKTGKKIQMCVMHSDMILDDLFYKFI